MHWRTRPSTTSSLEPAQSDHSGASASWPGPGKHCVPCSLALPPGNNPFCPSLDDAFRLTPLNPQLGLKGESVAPSAQPTAPGSLSSTQKPNPQTQEKPELAQLAQLASTQASCPSVCGWASCWRKGGLQLCSDVPGAAARHVQLAPGRAAAAALHAAVSRHSQGRWGQAVRAVKKDPLGTEEAVNKTPNCSPGLSQAASQSMPPRHATLQMNGPLCFTEAHTLVTCKPPPVFLHGYTIQLPFTPGTLETESRHPGDSPY